MGGIVEPESISNSKTGFTGRDGDVEMGIEKSQLGAVSQHHLDVRQVVQHSYRFDLE